MGAAAILKFPNTRWLIMLNTVPVGQCKYVYRTDTMTVLKEQHAQDAD